MRLVFKKVANLKWKSLRHVCKSVFVVMVTWFIFMRVFLRLCQAAFALSLVFGQLVLALASKEARETHLRHTAQETATPH